MSKASIKKNTVYNIVKTASTILFPLITFPYISRVLQPENVGKINFSNSITVYFSMLATLGVTTYAIRECVKVKSDKEVLGETASQIISINFLTTIFSYVLLFLLLCFSVKLREYRLLIIIQSLNIIFVTTGADWLNTAMEDFKYITIRTVAFQVLSIVLMFLLVKKPEDYLKYAGIMVLSSSGANVMNILYRRQYCHTRFTKKMNIRKHLPPILTLFAMIVSQQILVMSDTTIIGFTLGDFEVGLYSTAVKIYNIVVQVVSSITWVVMPQLSVAYAEDDVLGIKKILVYVLQFTAILGIPCTVGMFVLNKEIVLLVGGGSYLGASTVMRLLAISLIVQLIGNFVLNINLLAAGKDKVCLFVCAVASALNIITNCIFIPIFGINAAAITTIFSQVVVVLVCIPFLNIRIRFSEIMKIIVQPLIASAGLIVMLMLVCHFCHGAMVRICLSVGLGASMYFGILILMKNEFMMKMVNGFTNRT